MAQVMHHVEFSTGVKYRLNECLLSLLYHGSVSWSLDYMHGRDTNSKPNC